MTVSAWVLLVAAGVAVVCVVALVGIGLAGARRRPSGGPLVIAGRAVFVLLLLAVIVALVAGLWWSIGGAFATLSGGAETPSVWRGGLLS